MDDVEYPPDSEYDKVTNHSLTSIFPFTEDWCPTVCLY